MIGSREVDRNAGLIFNTFVVVELGPVVDRDRLEVDLGVEDQVDQSIARGQFASVWKFSDESEARLPFDERRDAILVFAPDNGVAFPVPDRLSRLY